MKNDGVNRLKMYMLEYIIYTKKARRKTKGNEKKSQKNSGVCHGTDTTCRSRI